MGHPSFLCIFLLALSLASVSGRPEDTLRKIKDLGDKDFGHNFPRHGLNLLYWFCSEYITFDNNDNMQPEKDPKQGAFGFHKYQNIERLLPSLDNQRGYAYYVVGNLNNGNFPPGERLPDYILKEFRQSENSNRNQRNRDRIIVRRTPYGTIDRVYITQHYDYSSDRGSQYDPENTYAVGTDLIRAIRNLAYGSFFQGFPPRTTTHYPRCHPQGEFMWERSAEECNHKFSDGSRQSSSSILVCLCCAVLGLLMGCF